MDAVRFDASPRDLAAGTTRRRTLAGLLGGAAGALGPVGADDTRAAKSGTCQNACGIRERRRFASRVLGS